MSDSSSVDGSSATRPRERSVVVKTPQELIHIKHGITLLQYKYWILMLKAYRDEYLTGQTCSADGYCYLSMSSLSDFLGYQPRKSELEADLEAIRREPIVFNSLEKDRQPVRRGIGFINAWSVSPSRVGVIFPLEIRRAVENLDNGRSIFNLLNWSIFNSFSGKHDAILYKLCRDYIDVGRTRYMPLEMFREYMGVQPTEYVNFKQLNQWVISRPVRNINESRFSDISVDVDLRKDGRKVVGVSFAVKRKSSNDHGVQFLPDAIMGEGDVSKPATDQPLSVAFADARIQIPSSLQKKYLNELDGDSICLCIRQANLWGEMKEADGTAVNWGAVYRMAINENWGADLRAREDRADKAVRIAQDEQYSKAVAQYEQQMAELKNQYVSFSKSVAIKNLSNDDRRAVLAAWIDGNRDSGRAGDFDVSIGDFKSPFNKIWFEQVYLREIVDVEFNETEFEDWLSTKGAIRPASRET